MERLLEEDNYLRIQLLSYHEPDNSKESYYFMEMSTLQATLLLPSEKKIIAYDISGDDGITNYFDFNNETSFKNIGDFNSFFISNPNYEMIDCNLEFENGLKISSHDDGEVNIEFPEENPDYEFLKRIFEKYNIDISLIEIMKSKIGNYISIDNDGKFKESFISFDDYLKNGL